MIWQQYARTAPYVQAFILVMILAMYYNGHFLLIQVLVVFATMEIGAVLGAAWAVRLKRKAGLTAPPFLPKPRR